jgi:beta-lactamase superfamily II metal-dependent hydrolase
MFGLKSTRSKWRWYLLGLLLLADISVWFWLWQEDRAGVLTVAVLDIGQGDSIFITAPNGNQVLIDGMIRIKQLFPVLLKKTHRSRSTISKLLPNLGQRLFSIRIILI